MNFILADPTLVSYVGHSFEYVRSINAEATSLGHKVTVLAHQRVDDKVVQAIQAIPCFRFHPFHQFPLTPWLSYLPSHLRQGLFEEWNYFCHAWKFRQDLQAVQDRLLLDQQTIAIFSTVSHTHILPVIHWVEQLPNSRRPWIALFMHFTASPDVDQPSTPGGPAYAFYRRAFRYLRRGRVKDRFRLFTDSMVLAAEYRNYTRLPIQVAPIPHADSRQAGSQDVNPSDPSGTIRLTYLGDARRGKGYQLLPYVFAKLRPELISGRIEAELQSSFRNHHEWDVVVAITRLDGQPGIKLHHGALTTSQYYEVLDRADIVLLPYTQSCYHTQTSGIFAEALARGKVVIVPRGTWLARELKNYGGGVAFLPGDRQDLYEACLRAIRDYASLKAKAMADRAAWRQKHCSASYIQCILNSLEGKVAA